MPLIRSSSFQRLAASVRVEHLCEKEAHRCDVSTSTNLVELLQRLEREQQDAFDPDKPILLCSELCTEAGVPVLRGAFPYAVLFPGRALRDIVEKTEGGEVYFKWADLEDYYLDEGGSDHIIEFNANDWVPGSMTLWDLLHADSWELLPKDAALVVTGVGEFGVLMLEGLVERPEAKACWLTAALELERAAATLCRTRLSDCLSVLPEERRKAALDRFVQRVSSVSGGAVEKAFWMGRHSMRADVDRVLGRATFSSILDPIVLEHTMFADKKTMLLKGPFASTLSVEGKESV